jgi:putative integral membrane protein (TIGR02587 family)
LFLMAVGSLFLGFNVAPTEEMMLISYQMTEWHALGLVLISVLLMHGFVFAAGFAGGSEASPDEPWWSPFVRLTLPGYVIAVTVSLYLLWIFHRGRRCPAHFVGIKQCPEHPTRMTMAARCWNGSSESRLPSWSAPSSPS